MQNDRANLAISAHSLIYNSDSSFDSQENQALSRISKPVDSLSDGYIERYKKRKNLKSPQPSLQPPLIGNELVKYQPLEVILYQQSSNNAVVFDSQAKTVGIRRMVPARSSNRNIDYYPQSQLNNEESFTCPTCQTRVNKSWFADHSLPTDSELSMNKNYFRYLADTLKKNNSLELTYPSQFLPEQQPKSYPIQTASSSTAHRSDSQQCLDPTRSNFVINGESTDYDSSNTYGLSQASFNNGYYKRFFVEGKRLGRGLRGSVFLCQHVLDNVFLGEYAIKKVAVGNNHSWLISMLKEVKLLESLNHPNIIEYKHSWIELHQPTTFGPSVPCLFILMEFANGGNLQEYMENRGQIHLGSKLGSRKKDNLSKKEKILRAHRDLESERMNRRDSSSQRVKFYLTLQEIWTIFSDICSGLNHLHKFGIIHRDLKPQNLLLFVDDVSHQVVGKNPSRKIPRLLLADFGECETMFGDKKRLRTGATGTMEFMAPELLKVDSNGKYLDEYSTKADMWSLGMLLYYLCYSQLPFKDIDNIDMLRMDILGLKIKFPDVDRGSKGYIGADLKMLISMLLNHNKSRRPDVNAILPQVMEKMLFYESLTDEKSRFENIPSSSTKLESSISGFKTGNSADFNKLVIPANNLETRSNKSASSSISEINGDRSSFLDELYGGIDTNLLPSKGEHSAVPTNIGGPSYRLDKEYFNVADSTQQDATAYDNRSLIRHSSSLPTESYIKKINFDEQPKTARNQIIKQDLLKPLFTTTKLRLLTNNPSQLSHKNSRSHESNDDLITHNFYGRSNLVPYFQNLNFAHPGKTLQTNSSYIKPASEARVKKEKVKANLRYKRYKGDLQARAALHSILKLQEKKEPRKNNIHAAKNNLKHTSSTRFVKTSNTVLFKYALFVIKMSLILNLSKDNKNVRYYLVPLTILAAIDLRSESIRLGIFLMLVHCFVVFLLNLI